MAVTTDKYSAQLSADATRLAQDLGEAGREVTKFKKDTDKTLSQEPTTPHGFIKGMKKDFKSAAKDIAFVGFAADHLADAFGGADSAIGKFVSAGKEIALGWSVGGSIGGPIGAVVGGIVGAAVALSNLLSKSDFTEEQLKRIDKFREKEIRDLEKEGSIFGDTNTLWKLNSQLAAEERAGILATKEAAEKLNNELRTKLALMGKSERETAIGGLGIAAPEGLVKGVLDKIGFGDPFKQMRDQINETFDRLDVKQATQSFDDFNASIQKQIDLVGKSTQEAALYELGLKKLTQEQLDTAAANMKMLENKQFAESIKKQTETLQNQADTFGMSPERAKLLEEMKKGAKGKDLAEQAFQVAKLEALRAGPAAVTGPNMALGVGSAAGIAAINKFRRENEQIDKGGVSKEELQKQANDILRNIERKLDQTNDNTKGVDFNTI